MLEFFVVSWRRYPPLPPIQEQSGHSVPDLRCLISGLCLELLGDVTYANGPPPGPEPTTTYSYVAPFSETSRAVPTDMTASRIISTLIWHIVGKIRIFSTLVCPNLKLQIL